jgi:hypothetical protein
MKRIGQEKLRKAEKKKRIKLIPKQKESQEKSKKIHEIDKESLTYVQCR